MTKVYDYDFINRYNAARHPSTAHSGENATAWYFKRYLIQKIISVYEFKGIPEEWCRKQVRAEGPEDLACPLP